jgi:hypothetical protein
MSIVVNSLAIYAIIRYSYQEAASHDFNDLDTFERRFILPELSLSLLSKAPQTTGVGLDQIYLPCPLSELFSRLL